MFKQLPINKLLIQKSKLFLPHYINEKNWEIINMSSWFKCIRYKYNIINNPEYNNICGIDIGTANFISIYSPNGECYKVKVDKNKIIKTINNKNITLEQKEKKLINLINELHIKTANLICNKFDKIYIGYVYFKECTDFQSIYTIEDNLTKILCHNKFLDILKKKSKKTNKELYIVDESFTSKTCSSCGELNKFERNQFGDDSDRRKYICKYCNGIWCRDLNAAICILIKNFKK